MGNGGSCLRCCPCCLCCCPCRLCSCPHCPCCCPCCLCCCPCRLCSCPHCPCCCPCCSWIRPLLSLTTILAIFDSLQDPRLYLVSSCTEDRDMTKIFLTQDGDMTKISLTEVKDMTKISLSGVCTDNYRHSISSYCPHRTSQSVCAL